MFEEERRRLEQGNYKFNRKTGMFEKKENNMHNSPSGTFRRNLIEDIANARRSSIEDVAISEQFDAFGDDIYEDGNILTWTTQFGREEGREYTYAVLRSGDKWWVTGKSDGPMDWYSLVAMWVTQYDVTPSDVYSVVDLVSID